MITAPVAETEDRAAGDRSARLATVIFAVAVVAALPFYLWVARNNWFFLDEWDFLADRGLSSPDDLLRAHNEHWSTLPIIQYRILWRLFGLRTYTPYVSIVIVAHLTTAVLLWVIMRRAQVNAWIALAAACLFVYLGTGYQNIVWAFQIGFVGSLVFGLAHLVLSDHDGPFDRRDALGLACGFAGLLCSGVSVTLVAVVGLSVLLRRGWRLALIHVVPLAAAFLVWYLAYGHETYRPGRPSPGQFLEFAGDMVWDAARHIATFGVVAVALIVVLVAGTAIWLSEGRRQVPRSFAPLALLGGTFLFALITSAGRAIYGDEGARTSRYVHLLCAMSLPALAVAADALARRWRSAVAVPLLAALFLVGIPGNVASVADADTLDERVLYGNPAMVETLPVVETAAQVPPGVEPDRTVLPGVTNGWLRSGNRSGRIHEPDPLLPQIAAGARLRLSLEQIEVPDEPVGCRPLSGSGRVTLQKGDRIRFAGGIIIAESTVGRTPRPRTSYYPGRGTALVARVDDLTVRLVAGQPSTVRCR